LALRTIDLKPQFSWKVNKTLLNSSFPIQYKLFTCHCGSRCPCECEWKQRWCPATTAEDGTISCSFSSTHVGFIGSVKVRALVPPSADFEDEECSCGKCQCSKYAFEPCAIPQEALYFSSPKVKMISIGEKDASFAVTLPTDHIFCLNNLVQVNVYFTIRKKSAITNETTFVKHNQVSFIENVSDPLEVHNHCINNLKTKTVNLFNLNGSTTYTITTGFVVNQVRFDNGISADTTVDFTTKKSANSTNGTDNGSNSLRIFVFVLIAVLVVLLTFVGICSKLKIFTLKKNEPWKPNEYDSYDSYLKVLFTQQSFQMENKDVKDEEKSDNINSPCDSNLTKISNDTNADSESKVDQSKTDYVKFESNSDDCKSLYLGSQSTVAYSYVEQKHLENTKEPCSSEELLVNSDIENRYVPKSSI